MGSGCCSGCNNLPVPPSAPPGTAVSTCAGSDDNCCNSSIAASAEVKDDCCSPSVPVGVRGSCDSDRDCYDDEKLQLCAINGENCKKCDDGCIVSAAAVNCKQECGSDAEEGADRWVSACTDHLQRAFDQYRSFLETARCICHNILEQTAATSCCAPKNKNALGTKDCRSTTPKGHSTALFPSVSKASSQCCNKREPRASLRSNIDDCCATVSAPVQVQTRGQCCGTGSVPCSPGGNAAPSITTIPRDRDVEKNSDLEHVLLSVTGMTCNDCASKLERNLKSMPGIFNVHIDFIQGRADLSIDPSILKIEDVIRSGEKATGFQLAKMVSGDEGIDLLAPKGSVEALFQLNIPGIKDVAALNKTTIRVAYDPALIGARDLVHQIGGLSDGLAPPEGDSALTVGRKRFNQLLIKTIIATVLTIPVLVLSWGPDLVSEKIRAVTSLILATLVQIIAVPVFYAPALKALIRYGVVELDMLVVVSITAAFIYSVVAFGNRMANNPLETGEFFETSTLLISLVMMGRLLASYARIRAVAAVSLRSLQPSTALLVGKGENREIDSRLLQYGDKFKVLPHSRIPTDGSVIDGTSEVDESMLTGESIPVTKQPSSNVIAGTVNGSGTLHVRLIRLPGKNTVTDIAELVEKATHSKPKIQDVADRIASWFLPLVSGIAIVTLIIWVIVGLRLRQESAGTAVANAVTYAVAVLAVSCPCALGLAVPMVLVVAGGIAARGGVIIKSAECTERVRKVTDVVFDKTGTLTEPDLDVVAEEYIGNRDDTISLVKALVLDNKHPISVAVAKHMLNYDAPSATITNLSNVSGAGVEATSPKGAVLRAGNPHWTNNDTHPTVRRLLEDGMSILLITLDSIPVAVYGLRTRLRPEAVTVVSTLRRRGITVHLVSGDQPHAVESVASAVGIDPVNVASQRKPDQKQSYVASLMSENKVVLFCGDGTNDAVAVAQADIGVQLSDSIASSDVTRGAADAVLLSGLKGIPFLLDVSQAAFRRIIFNFVWSVIYNVFAISLAAGAFVKIRIPPAYAGAGEMVSVLPVIAAAISMLLLKLRP